MPVGKNLTVHHVHDMGSTGTRDSMHDRFTYSVHHDHGDKKMMVSKRIGDQGCRARGRSLLCLLNPGLIRINTSMWQARLPAMNSCIHSESP